MKYIKIYTPQLIIGENYRQYEVRIRCDCGWQDKTFAYNARIAANTHNEMHDGKYEIAGGKP